MKIENQVCSLEQSKRLKELCVTQQSIFKYNQNLYENAGDINEGVWTIWYNNLPCAKNQIAAFTVADLGVMLPIENITWATHIRPTEKGTYCHVVLKMEAWGAFETEARGRAALLIHLLENNLITVEEVNQRLLNS